jgi:hypothetical protein
MLAILVFVGPDMEALWKIHQVCDFRSFEPRENLISVHPLVQSDSKTGL